MQGDEWRRDRCGSVGASDVPRVVRKIKSGGYSADRAQLLAEKVIERLTGVPHEGFKSAAMLRGLAVQDEARDMYALITGVEVEPVDLVRHPRIAGTHASPDGLVGPDGGVEIKCPLPAAHLDTLLHDTIDGDYRTQAQWQMACTGRRWVDFVSYHPDFPVEMRLYRARLYRDAPMIGELEIEVGRFLGELAAKLARLTQRYARAAA